MTTSGSWGAPSSNGFQSTPSAWRVTQYIQAILPPPEISIHTLRVEGDRLAGVAKFDAIAFQSTPSAWRVTEGVDLRRYLGAFQSTPSAWRVTYNGAVTRKEWLFQSTPSAWRVTDPEIARPKRSAFQSTPSAWRVTKHELYLDAYNKFISIHTLRVEGDSPGDQGGHGGWGDFNPHPPRGG